MKMYTPHIVLFGGNEATITDLKKRFDRHVSLKFYRLEDASVFTLAEADAALFAIFAENNGAKALAAVHALQLQFPSIPCVVLALNVPLEEVDDYFRAGCSRFLVYPEQIDRFQDLIAGQQPLPAEAMPTRYRNNFTSTIMSLINQALSVGIVPKAIARIINLNTLPELPPNGVQTQFLGNFEVRIEGTLLPELKGKKLKLLLAYL
ncbi:MAG: hypothetical protein HUU01_24025, partial [Saprospiraceae bacterium]|nr:hypothetical protein [Saprospiraceae bacterium]